MANSEAPEDRFHAELAARLTRWYLAEKREFPWRGTSDPYAVLVSETMLQQTQAERVNDYYARWMVKFPTFAALARADEDEAVAMWQGLGYYSRARALLKTARILTESGLETLPPDAAFLRKLPGVGPYTAGAVCSIAFDLPVPAVDGNVRRVFARLLNLDLDPAGAKGAALIARHAEAVLGLGSPRVLAQAFMELGAMVCTPGRSPNCALCPAASLCAACEAGTQAIRPVSTKKSPVVRREGAAVLIGGDGGYYLRRRPARGLWARFYEIPWMTADEGESAESCFARLAGELGIVGECRSTDMDETLKFTRWQVRVRLWTCSAVPKVGGELVRKSPREAESLPMPAGLKRLVLKALRARKSPLEFSGE